MKNQNMKNEERDEKLKSLLDKDFLDRLKEIGKLWGWNSGDYTEVQEFIYNLYQEIDIDMPFEELEAYEIEYK